MAYSDNIDFRPDRSLGGAEDVEFRASKRFNEATQEMGASPTSELDRGQMGDGARGRESDLTSAGTGVGSGLRARAGDLARQASGTIGRGTEFIRSQNVGDVAGDIEGQIRSHPIASVGLALGAGFLIGRMLD